MLGAFCSNMRVHKHFVEPTGSLARRPPKSSKERVLGRDFVEETCGTELASKSVMSCEIQALGVLNPLWCPIALTISYIHFVAPFL